MRVRRTLNPYDKKGTSKNRIVYKNILKTNTIVKKSFTDNTIIHISIARTDRNKTLKMLRT